MKKVVYTTITGKKRILDVVGIIIFIVLVVLMGGNSENPDMLNYINTYGRNSLSSEGAWLGARIINICNSFGIEFKYYRLILCILGLYILYVANKKLTDNNKWFYVLYFICPFIMDSTQLDNFLCMCFVMLGFSFIVNVADKYATHKFIVSVIIASGFHIIGIMYIPVIFLMRIKRNQFSRKTIILFASIYTSITLFINVSSLANVLSIIINTIIPSSDYLKYFSSQMGNGKYLFYGMHALCCLFSFYLRRITNEFDGFDEKTVKVIDTVFWFNIYGLFFLPILRFEATLFRFNRNMLILDYIAAITMIKALPKKSSRKIFTIVFICMICLIYGYFTFNLYWDTVVGAFFESNWILFGG